MGKNNKNRLVIQQEDKKMSRTARLHFSNKEKVDLPADYSQKLWKDLNEGNIQINGFLTIGNTTYSLFQVIKIEWDVEPFNYSFNFVGFEENKCEIADPFKVE